MQLFEAADVGATGSLELDELQDLLQAGNFGLTRAQILAVLAEADAVDDFVGYAEFVPVAASLISRMLDVRATRAKQ